MITGTKEAVAAAKKKLEARIIDLDIIVEDTMTVDPKHHHYFKGKQSKVLGNISDEFGGVVVIFSRKGVASDNVLLKGAKSCIEGAMARIEEIVQDLMEQVTLNCDIEQQFHRTLMGAKGSKVEVQLIEEKFNVKITMVKNLPNPNIIQITGKKDNCESATQALLQLVPITAEVSVPVEFHR